MFLRPAIKQIYILLGRNCNFNCRYCTQIHRHEEIKQLPTKINDDIFKFIEQVVEQSCDVENFKPVSIQLYGGEPLMYFDKIKYIVQRLKPLQNAGKINYSTMSNGSFTKEQVKYFNDHHLDVGISWDGHQKDTRFHDILEENKDNLFELNSFHVSGVISSYCYPKQMLQDFQDFDDQYFKRKNRHVNYFLIDSLYDSGIDDRTLFKINYKRVYSEMYEISDKAIKNLISGDFHQSEYVLTNFIKAHINFIKNVSLGGDTKGFKNISPDKICYCGNGYWVYNIDLNGNLYTCHNNNFIAGTIYNDYWKYLGNVLRDDHTQYFYQKMCKNCLAFPLCLGGCKHISEQIRKETACKLQKALYIPIIRKILQFSKELS